MASKTIKSRKNRSKKTEDEKTSLKKTQTITGISTVTKRSKRKKPKRKKLSAEDIEKNNYRKEIRSIFLNSGFKRIPNISDKEFLFRGVYKSDFDDVFVYENVIVFNEYTLTKSSNISAHLKPKKIIFDIITQNQDEFLEFLFIKFPSLKEGVNSIYSTSQLRIIILYCSKNDVENTYKAQVPNIKFLDYPVLKYFKSVSEAVKLSSRFEIFKFFDLEFKEIGNNILNTRISKIVLHGNILPENHSNFKKGYKVVSFYIDPDTLLTHSYVLRKEGWRDESEVYQRMIINSKIVAIRKYLLREERVFINNIIITLPDKTKILDDEGCTVDTKTLQETKPVELEIPNDFNVIGLIDGQHRVFAYHEGGEKDDEIGKLRKKQNLLVTGIIYPRQITDIDKIKFEAKLFLEINSNQSNAKSALKQSIGLILNPFTAESIAKSFINKLNSTGPLANNFERHFYEKDKVKTTSIVSYGLKPIIKLSGTDSFFYLWDNPNKSDLINKTDDNLLIEYLNFATSKLNIFFNSVKENVGLDRWTTDSKVPNKILSTTTINGLIVCYRKIIENNKIEDFEGFKKRLIGIDKFDFKKYKSSQYGAMGVALFEKYFK